MSEEQKIKLRVVAKTHPTVSEETKAKQSAAVKEWWAKRKAAITS